MFAHSDSRNEDEKLMRFGSQCEPSVRLVLQKCCLYDPMETVSCFCPCVWLTRPHLSPSWRPPRLAASHSSVPSGTDLCRTCLILCSCMEGPLVPGFTLRNARSAGFRGSGPFTVHHFIQVSFGVAFLARHPLWLSLVHLWSHECTDRFIAA